MRKHGNIVILDNDAALERDGTIEAAFLDLNNIALALEAAVMGERLVTARDYLVRQLQLQIAATEKLVRPHA